MRGSLIKIICAGWLAGFLLGNGMAQTPASPKPQARLDDLKFISGHWQSEMDGGISDEHWSLPMGDGMMGMFRYIKDGKWKTDEYKYKLLP